MNTFCPLDMAPNYDTYTRHIENINAHKLLQTGSIPNSKRLTKYCC